MKKSQAIFHSLGHAILVLIYTSAVAWILYNGNHFFGPIHSFVGPLGLLLLFVFSATVVGALVLGRPILLYLDGYKKEALQFFAYTVGWMFLLTLSVFATFLNSR